MQLHARIQGDLPSVAPSATLLCCGTQGREGGQLSPAAGSLGESGGVAYQDLCEKTQQPHFAQDNTCAHPHTLPIHRWHIHHVLPASKNNH